MRKNVILTALALSIIAIVSCNDDEKDSVAPTAKIIAPTKDSEQKIGGELHFEVELSDNVELRSYKVDIHSAGSHQHSAEPVAWSFQKEVLLIGKKNAHEHEHFAIPAEAKAGEYHLVVYCTDVSGNETIAYTDFILIP